jgi:7-carboxy-7-deazaguanine synthase
MKQAKNVLFISEIFYSLQGESSRSGRPCIFIRLAGCDLNCSYCDTKYARTVSSGHPMSINRIIGISEKFPSSYICLTGGEPLLQKNIYSLCALMLGKGYEISIETNGCNDISRLDHRIHIVMDIKCPASGHSGDNLPENIRLLKASDEVKFVLSGRKDYLWAKNMIRGTKLAKYCPNIILSPAHGNLKPEMLASWMLKDGTEARLQLQLHKILGLK